MNHFKVLAALFILLSSTSLHAEYWIGVGTGMATVGISVDAESQDDLTLEANLRAGVELNKYFSIEAQFGVGTGGFFELDGISCGSLMQAYGGDVSNCDGGSADISGRKARAVYLRTALPNRTPFTPYLLTGYSYNKLEFDGDNGNTSTSIEDFAFGIGLGMTQWVRVEWLQQGDKDGIKINSTSLNMIIAF